MNVPHLKSYRHGEYLQYLKDVLQLLNEQNAETLQLTAQQSALQSFTDAIDVAFKQSQGSVISEELATLDEQRDDAFTGLRTSITGYRYHYEPNIADAAGALLRNIETHGPNIQRLSYQEETAVLTSIVTDWENEPELSEAITLLQLNDWVAHLKTTNNEFSSRYLLRVEEQAANSGETVSELRIKATEAYRDLINHLNAHTTLGTTPEHSALQAQIGVLAGQYNQVVENRTGSENDTDAPTADPAPDTPAS